MLIQMNAAERKPPMTMHGLTDKRLAELRTIASNVGLEFDYGCVDDDNTETVAEWMSSCSKNPGAPAAGHLWAVYAPTDEREGLTIGAITGDGPQAQYYAEHIAAFDPPTVIALLDELERLRSLLADVEVPMPEPPCYVHDEGCWDIPGSEAEPCTCGAARGEQ